MYRFKPGGLDELEYQQPYIDAAQSLLHPNEAIGVAIGGMGLGADPSSFQNRLMRHPTVQQTAPFISGLRTKLEQMKGVLA